jgi:regulator of sirC expression with transglutaminase-like and TPR domain
MDMAERWGELMDCSEQDLPLDEAALVIAAHAQPGLDVGFQLRRLDRVAAEISEPSSAAVCRLLFERIGLHGDRRTYDDPRNSYLDQVLERHQGIPISLSVVLMEVGRRCGLHLEGVGMPGHFLVRDRAAPNLLIDAFDGGTRLDRRDCERLLRQVAGPGAELAPGMLSTTAPRAILARMLANLDRSFERRSDRRSLQWVSRLRLAIPDLPPGERVQLAGRLSYLGRFDAAAAVLDQLAAAETDSGRSERFRAEAVTLLARCN